MDFDRRCAEMTLRGWRPVKTANGRVGIYNRDIEAGFAIRVQAGDFALFSLSPFFLYGGDITWEELGERALTLIETRLNQT